MLIMSALNSLWWLIYISNSVDETKIIVYALPPSQHHSFFRNLFPFVEIPRYFNREISSYYVWDS